MEGPDSLQWMIDTLRKMPQLAADVAPEVADAVRVQLKATSAAGTDPFGKKWEPRKEDGGRAMANAAGAVYVGAVKTRILAVVKGPEALHDRGHSRGGVERPIIPHTNLIPPRVEDAVRDVLNRFFTERTQL